MTRGIVKWWDVYEGKKRIGTVIAYNEKQAITEGVKNFEWNRTCYPYHQRYEDTITVKCTGEVKGNDLTIYRKEVM